MTLGHLGAKGRRVVGAAVGAALVVSAVSTLAVATAAPATADPVTPGHLVISEVNGDQSGVYRSNWVELYNPTGSAVSLGTIDTSSTPATVHPNYYLCYAGPTAASCTAPYKLYGTILAHHHFLVEIYDAGTTLPALPAGVTPDLNFATSDTSVNPSQQAAKNIGGYATGGQLLLLDASIDKTGAYPTPATVAGSTYSSTRRNLGDASVNPSPVVDAIGYTPTATASTLAGSEGWISTTAVHSAPVQDSSHWDERTFVDGIPQDTNDNAADFQISHRDPISQASTRVAVAAVSDATISRNEAMAPITVVGSKGIGTLSYAATGLPDGVSVDPATGTISGTPSTADALRPFAVTVAVSDQTPGTPDTATTSFTLTLSGVLRVDPIADVSARKSEALSPIQTHAHGGTPGYTYTATGLPAGVSIDPTGVISGTPTGAVGTYAVHITVTDSGTGTGDDAQQSVSIGFTLTELPALPAPGDPLSGLRINEVKATGTPAKDWVEIYNTGDDITGGSVDLADDTGAVDHVTGLTIAHHGFSVVEGAALDAAGLDLTAQDTLSLLEVGDQTELDRTTWTSFPPTSWARTVDGAGTFAVSAYATKGAANPGAPVIDPNDLLVTEVNYDNNSTDYYEYSEVTNTTNHPIDLSAYGLTLTKSGTAMTLHDPSDTTATSPTIDPVIPAHGTQLFWWVETQYYGVKTTSQFLANYGLAPSTPVVLVFGFSSLANSGGDHSYYLSVNQGATPISQAWVDTPCAANTLNGSAVCPATNGNYAEHYELPTDRTSPLATPWYNSLHSGGDDVQFVLKTPLSTPGSVDLEQLGYSRAVTISSVAGNVLTLHNTSTAPVDLSGYVLQKDGAGTGYALPSGTTVAAGADLVVGAATSGLTFGDRDFASLLAPPGYAYTDGLGLADTTGPFLHTLSYDASSGQPPTIDPTTGLPLPPAGGLYRPAGVSAQNGAVYASNTGDNLLAALANGSNTVVAGALDRYGFDPGQDGGAAVDASLYQPSGTAIDSAGNVYVADSGDNVVLEITKADGKIHLVAGTGVAGGAGATITAGSTGKTVNLYRPESVAIAGNGDLYIADTYDNRIVEVTPAGAARLVAGTGKAGYTGDGAAATNARLSQPAGLALDSAQDVYVADSSNNVIRRIDAHTGVITTVAGDYAADQKANSCLGGYGGDGGPATSALLNDPQGIALDGAGDLFIADTFNNAIREVAPDGTISTVVNAGAAAGSENTSPAGSGSVPGRTMLNTPFAVSVDSTTNALYVADTRNNSIAEVLHLVEPGDAAGPIEPTGQVPVTGSGTAFAACDALANPPLVTAVSPSIGPRTGSTTVTLTGTHFTGTTGVEFGGVAGTGVIVQDDSHLLVTTPAHAVGHVDVTVTNAAGGSTSTPADQFTFSPILPVVTAVSPATGAVSGRTAVTVTGSHFTGATDVNFGTAAGTAIDVVDDSHLTVITPAHAAGRVDVTVTNPEGASIGVPADGFTYLPPGPVITRVSPAGGLTTGGTAVTVTGSHLTGTTHVRFGTAAGTRVAVVDDSHLRVLSPAHAAGRVDVTVTAAGGVSSVVAADRFTYTTPACTYVTDFTTLARTKATLAKDEKSLAADKAALKKARAARTKAALQKKIAALTKTVTADRRAAAAAQRVVTVDSGHSWCRSQVAAEATLTRAQAKLTKDQKTLAGAKAALKRARAAKTKATLRKKISALNKTITADHRAVAAAQKAVRASR